MILLEALNSEWWASIELCSLTVAFWHVWPIAAWFGRHLSSVISQPSFRFSISKYTLPIGLGRASCFVHNIQKRPCKLQNAKRHRKTFEGCQNSNTHSTTCQKHHPTAVPRTMPLPASWTEKTHLQCRGLFRFSSMLENNWTTHGCRVLLSVNTEYCSPCHSKSQKYIVRTSGNKSLLCKDQWT